MILLGVRKGVGRLPKVELVFDPLIFTASATMYLKTLRGTPDAFSGP